MSRIMHNELFRADALNATHNDACASPGTSDERGRWRNPRESSLRFLFFFFFLFPFQLFSTVYSTRPWCDLQIHCFHSKVKTFPRWRDLEERCRDTKVRDFINFVMLRYWLEYRRIIRFLIRTFFQLTK